MMVRQVRFAEVQKEAGAETLSRVYVQEDGQTLYRCVLLELPWRDNQNNLSRIPEGRYVFEQLETSQAFNYRHFWVHDEDSHMTADTRAGIKWHIANFARQLRGCGAPGREFVDLDGDGLLDVTHSETTLNELLDVAPEQTELHIENRELKDMPAAEIEDVEGVPLDETVSELTV